MRKATPAALPQRQSRRLQGQAPLSLPSPTGGVVGSAATTPFGGTAPLNPAQHNYAQIEKEALSLVYGVKHFHQYVYSRKFELITDQKLLLAILGLKNRVPSLAAARLQRWAVLLSAYSYDIHFKATEDNTNAN